MIRIGLIGGGAAVRQLHLPAIANGIHAKATWIADIKIDQARMLASRYGIEHVTADYTQIGEVDAVLVAVPHYLHAPICEFFLSRGVHVLCEKPLSIKAEDAERLVALAKEKKLVLAVGVFRRYYPVSDFFRLAVAKEWLGQVERIDAEEGWPYEWNLQSPFMMQKEKAGGGTLIDTGTHTLDRLLWWFGCPEVHLDTYYDNSENGVESDCEIRFSISWRGHEIPVRAELSRTRTLRNTFQIFMSDGLIETPVNVPAEAWFIDHRLTAAGDSKPQLFINIDRSEGFYGTDTHSYFEVQLNDFCTSIKTGREPLNAGSSVLSLVRFIESCYAQRRPMQEPWVDFQTEKSFLAGDQV